ncbi:MAG TPA: VWA domain-containing protein [Acidobacteriaceae bacterium]|jgi:VWFA-related protein|nr:VWA domain-containing protein [Acidobacteriaceae bacterium]
MPVLRAPASRRALCLALPVALLFSSATALPAQSDPKPATAPGQTTQTPAPAASAPTLATTVDEVSLDLVVRNKKSKPILDLKASDFIVTDNGAPVSLSDLHLVTGQGASDHLVTFLFDRLDPSPAKTAREIAAKIIKAIPDRGYTFAVLQMNGRLRLVQSYTDHRELIDKAILSATTTTQGTEAGLSPAEKELIAAAQGDSLSVDSAERARAKLLVSGLEESQRILEDQHAYPSLSALLALARTQRQITGRKLVVYFAQGFNADSDARDTIKSVVGQANRAGVTICAVDADAYDKQVNDRMMGAMAMAGSGGGVGATMHAATSLADNGYGRGGSGPPIGQVLDAAQNMSSLEFDSMDQYKSPLINLADGTGGIYIKPGHDSKRPLQQLHDDLTSYYEASYTPSIKKYDGQFRPIEVHPVRKDLIVRSRSGYFAIPPENASGIRPFEVPLLALLDNPTLPTDLPLRTSVLHLGHLPDGNTGSLTVQIPFSELEAHEDATTHLSAVHVSIVALIKNEKGDVLQRFSEDLPLHEAPDVLRSDRIQVVTMQRHFTAEPGSYTLETVALDRISNKAGANRTAFTIDPVPPGPSLSDIALVRTVEPVHEETESFEPMRYANGRIIPDLSAELPEKTRSLSVFFMVHPVAGSATQPKLEMQIIRNGEPLGTMPLELRKVSETGAAIPYLGTIQGHVFPPGNYQVKAILNQDGHTASSTTSFSVEGTIAASTAPAASFTATSEASSDQHLTANAVVAGSQFVIASPTNPVALPTEAEIHDTIEAARQRALAWSETLPNFFCVETTDHSVDPSGHGDWHHKDTMIQIMRYIDHKESRTTLELNGQRSSVEADDLDFAHSVGEFGGMFQLVFDPSAKANFTWKESDVLDGQPVQVFGFKVDMANSNFDLTGLNNRQHAVGFHGLVYLDTATHSVRRITIDADDIPENLLVRASSISVDYSWVTINNHDYLMPLRGAISLREGKHQAVLNEFDFRNYRRFGAQVRILSKEESKALPPS